MSKYAFVEKDECISCGACVATAPEIFDFDSDNLSQNIFENDNNTGTTAIPNHLEAELDEAATGCPTEAIKVQDQPFN